MIEALLSGSLFAPDCLLQRAIFRVLQIPVGYVWVCVFKKVRIVGKVRQTHVLTRIRLSG